MAPTRSLNVVVTGDSKPLGVAAKQADKHMGSVEKGAGRMGKAVKAGFAVAAVGTGAVIVGLKKSVDAAVDAEKSQAKLKAQLNASGASYRAHAKEIDAVIQKHSRLAGVDDEDLQDAFTGLVRSTGKVSVAMKDMGLVTDIMRGKNVDAAASGKILEKVHNGNVTGLKKLGIAIDPVTKAQDKLKASNKDATAEQVKAAKAADKAATAQKGIAELQKRFGGQAAAYGKTAAGAQDRFAVAMENVQEKLGAKLLPVLSTVANGVSKFLDQIDKGTGAGGKFGDIISGAFNGIKAVVGAVIPPVVAAFGTFSNWIQENRPRIDAFATQVKDRLVSAFNTAKGAVASVVAWLTTNVPPAFDAVKGAVVTAFSAVKGAVSSAIGFIKGWIDRNKENIEAFGKAWQNIGKGIAIAVGAIAIVLKTVLVPAFNVIWDVVKAVWPGIRQAIEGALKAIGGVVKVFSGIFTGDFRRIWEGVKDIFSGAIKAVLGILGGLAAAAWTILKKAGGLMQDGIMAGLKGLARLLWDFLKGAVGFLADGDRVAGVARSVGKVVGSGILSGLGSLGHLLLDKVKDALGFVAGALPSAAKSVGGAIKDLIGDGVGRISPPAPSGGLSGGGSLMGAKSIMSPFVSMAGRFGLHTSSGLRPGAITSSGNPSWHGTGNAVDEAGTPEGMMGYFRYLKAKFGSRLRELIYTPGGQGIKDGKPFTYTGQVAADHFDHVHVAFTGGAGDGVGRTGGSRGRAARTGDGGGRARGYKGFYNWASKTKLDHHPGTGAWQRALGDYAKSIGADPATVRHDHGTLGDKENWLRKWNRGATADGIGRVSRTGDGLGAIKALWTREGGSASQQNMAAAIAMAESGGNPNASNRNTDGSIDRGLWQINSIHGAQSTFDREGNARAAVSISSNGRNWNPWTVFKTGAYKRFLGAAAGTKADGGSGGSSKGDGKSAAPSFGGFNLGSPSTFGAALGDYSLGGQVGNITAAQGAANVLNGTPTKGALGKGVVRDGDSSGAASEVQAGPTTGDLLARDLAAAQLTDSADDDRSVYERMLEDARGRLGHAINTGDIAAQTAAYTDIKSFSDSIKALDQSTQDNTAALQAHTDALKGVQDELKRQTDFATSVQNTSNFQLTKTLADFVSGHIVGYGVAGRSFTPGTGTEYSY